MSSLFANKVTTNTMCSVSVTTLYCSHYLMWHCSNLYHVRNNNYNSNYSFVILICLQSFCKPHFSILLTSFFFKHYTYSLDLHNGDLQTTMQLHTRLTELPLTRCQLYLAFLYVHALSLPNVLKVERLRSRLLENSRIQPNTCICAFSYLSVPFSLMLVVIGLRVRWIC